MKRAPDRRYPEPLERDQKRVLPPFRGPGAAGVIPLPIPSAMTTVRFGAPGQLTYTFWPPPASRLPWWTTSLVICLPVGVLGMAAALAHLIREVVERWSGRCERPVSIAILDRRVATGRAAPLSQPPSKRFFPLAEQQWHVVHRHVGAGPHIPHPAMRAAVLERDVGVDLGPARGSVRPTLALLPGVEVERRPRSSGLACVAPRFLLRGRR